MVRFRALIAAACLLVVSGCAAGIASPTPGQSGAAQLPGSSLVDLEAAVRQLKRVPPRLQRPPGLESSVFEDADSMDEFLTSVLQAIEQYWSLTFAENALPEPEVGYLWMQPGQSATTGCASGGVPHIAGDQTAAYCSADDTIYISQQFAFDLWEGLVGSAPADFLPGDFGVAYVVAHEYGHNIQTELQIRPRGESVKNHELMADCLAGTWARWAYRQGQLELGDVEEALATANLGGDLDFMGPDQHGTPQERSGAWILGYDSGQPARCAVYDTETPPGASPAASPTTPAETPSGGPPGSAPPAPPAAPSGVPSLVAATAGVAEP